MAAPAANAVPDWRPVFNSSKASIFFIEFQPKPGEKVKESILEIATKAGSKKGDDLTDACNAPSHCATGFASAVVEGGRILITTTAHIVEHLYRSPEQPVHKADLKKLYNVYVYCTHSQEDCIRRGATGEDDRAYFPAVISSIDCAKDLLMLRADVSDIALRFRTVGRGMNIRRQTVRCETPHPALEISTDLDTTGPCLLLSWPGDLVHTHYQGYQGLTRFVGNISKNVPGYDMHLLEAQIGSTAGSSGGPLLNLSGRVIGILHGGFNGPHSFFVSAQHLRDFLVTARQDAIRETAHDLPVAANQNLSFRRGLRSARTAATAAQY